MSDHIHVVASDGATSIASEHREWLSEDQPCTLCGAIAEESREADPYGDEYVEPIDWR
jgi:hypothetical protein